MWTDASAGRPTVNRVEVYLQALKSSRVQGMTPGPAANALASFLLGGVCQYYQSVLQATEFECCGQPTSCCCCQGPGSGCVCTVDDPEVMPSAQHMASGLGQKAENITDTSRIN